MNVLMSLAVIGAFAIKEYSEAATVVFLFSLAELLESFGVSRARRTIRAVLKLTPQNAQVKRGNAFESVPVSKKPGDQVFAGTINENGGLTVEVTKAFQPHLISIAWEKTNTRKPATLNSIKVTALLKAAEYLQI